MLKPSFNLLKVSETFKMLSAGARGSQKGQILDDVNRSAWQEKSDLRTIFSPISLDIREIFSIFVV